MSQLLLQRCRWRGRKWNMTTLSRGHRSDSFPLHPPLPHPNTHSRPGWDDEVNLSSNIYIAIKRVNSSFSRLPDITSVCVGARRTLISPPQHHRPGNPSSAPAYGSSGSALPPAACALPFCLSLANRMTNRSAMNEGKRVKFYFLSGWFWNCVTV